jgi:hypothetical protein
MKMEKEKEKKENADDLLAKVYKRISELEQKLQDAQETAYKLDDEIGSLRFKLMEQKQA